MMKGVLLMMLLVLLAGCKAGPDTQPEEAPVVLTPELQAALDEGMKQDDEAVGAGRRSRPGGRAQRTLETESGGGTGQ